MLNSLPEYRGGYAMEGRLAESGSGPVYRARDANGRAVAVKVLEGSTDSELPDRLRAEANLKHENILAILDLFQNQARIGIVTEILEGHSLRDLMAEDPAPNLLDRIEIMTRAGEALRYAHANGVAHRSLKPWHIHILPDGTVKIRSFSIDLLPQESQYAAPEQLLEHPVDALCNIFSYGVILNELTARCEERPPLLASIIQRASNQDRESRYQSFEELLADVARLLLQLRKTDLHFSGLFEAVPQPLQEDLHFTVYQPCAVRPDEWKTLLAFAHLSERPPDQDVQLQDSTVSIPHEGELTFVPEIDGIEFNPRRAGFLWRESVHRASFRLRASPAMDGETARGQMCVYLGSIVVAQVALTIEVNSQRTFEPGEEALTPVTVARYRRIFASYSHQDSAVVEDLERYSRAMGDEYLRGVMQLRSGEVWNDRLAQTIEQADVFQLFWSSNSMRSSHARQEWEYALTLNRDCFVRPVYWEEPLPEVRELNLPPDALRSLHFHRVVLGAAAASPPPLPPVTYAPSPAVFLPKRRRTGFQWAAALLIIFGVGGLSWYGLRSREAAPDPIASNIPPTPVSPEPVPEAPSVTPEPDRPLTKAAPASVRSPQPTATTTTPPGPTARYILTLWSRGTQILQDQTIRGDDPFLQSSFTLDGAAPPDAGLSVEWYLNGALSGITEFEPSEKGRHKLYMNQPRDGNYKAVLLVNREEVAIARFSYRK